jgi:RimJ/RimL family protein N-acetyltransferase
MRISLDELRDEDSDVLFAWINDRELVEHSAVFRNVTRAEHEAWLARVRVREDVAIFAIREGGRLVGTCQLILDGDAAELRIRIGEADARDRGLGREALHLLLAHGFGALGLERIWLQVFRRNARAIRAYESVGFTVGRSSPDVLVMELHGDGATAPSSTEE